MHKTDDEDKLKRQHDMCWTPQCTRQMLVVTKLEEQHIKYICIPN
jgi:hypothetical protein